MCTAVLGGGAAYPPEIFGRTGSLKEYLSIHNPKQKQSDRYGRLGTWMMEQIRRYVELYNVTIVEYAGAVIGPAFEQPGRASTNRPWITLCLRRGPTGEAGRHDRRAALSGGATAA